MLRKVLPRTLENCKLERFGTTDDGDYLLCGNLSRQIQSAYSYGVGPDDSFGCDVSKRYGVPVHQYDCFDPARPACSGGVFVFHDECIGPQKATADERLFDTLESQIARNGDLDKRLIVKMDIEGAEWDSLLAAPDAVLDWIDQLAIEFHHPDDPKALELVRRLSTKFYPVDLHFNNHACGGAEPLPASAFQVLWVNQRIGRLDQNAPGPAPSSELATPDLPGTADCQLSVPAEPPRTRHGRAKAARPHPRQG